jgi:hypothetical protein
MSRRRGGARSSWSAVRILIGLLVATLAASIAGLACAASILFVGNSFIYGEGSPEVSGYRPDSVSDLNKRGFSGVAALFKTFTEEAGLDYDVSLETVGGSGLKLHYDRRRELIDRRWDEVVLTGQSLLDTDNPGDPASLVEYSGKLAELFHRRNPEVEVWINATWSRPDQTYPETGHWHGQPIGAMALDVRAGADAAAKASAAIKGVIPAGQAFTRAIDAGVAEADPDMPEDGKLDLWAPDGHHASASGYYLEALVVFGAVTGKDPAALGPAETAAAGIGLTPDQAAALQQVAHDELAAEAAPAAPKGQ